ncbi:methyltransferase domain-containing protein [Methylobacterium sp. C25]|uniref:SAM-dependent methyltransferase n=1 Tax=Methylobacterium sp. C25 TaxID=2721622 RepID=UPI001F351B2D|nr:SAM-dependent methyltransferase [Methylobacterium sp. C25]MCE4226207.1 methyltransferase domain-containing protein [Methylobacterium sp. C25]
MSRHSTSLSPEYFSGVYADDPDPWRFATSDYEREKYATTLASLPRDRYASVLEVGCSIGVLTRQLAGRCQQLTALDVVPAVLASAQSRCAALDHVRFQIASVPGEWPDGHFDLILLSEVIYYLDCADLARLVARVEGSLLPGGDVVLVHYLGETDYPLSGDEAADGFIERASAFAKLEDQSRQDGYRLDVLRRIGFEAASS